MQLPTVPETAPAEIAPETFLIPNLYPAGPDLFVPANSLVIRGAEPIVVDTGAPVHRDQWLEKVASVVDPRDVRWIFLSHDDGDHTGGLLDILELAPQATLVTNFFSVERLALDKLELPLDRMRWIEAGESFHAGDRTIQLFLPPIFDGPTTRGLYDPTTATAWVVDTFACLTPGSLDVHDLPADHVEEQLLTMNSLVSPWHQWVDPGAYGRHIDSVEAMGIVTAASAHGPVMTGDAIHQSFDLIRELAGRPTIPSPGQELLDELVAATLVGVGS
jgi:flavorubredoxin